MGFACYLNKVNWSKITLIKTAATTSVTTTADTELLEY